MLIGIRRTRLRVQSKESIVTTQYFTDDYRVIIKERDKSFYEKNNLPDKDNFKYVIKKYTGDDYSFLNNYLKTGQVEKFSKKDLKSWAYCLHSSLQFRTSNVKNGTIVYRGVSLPAPKDWKVGKKFYFPQFISTSLDENIAINFSCGETLMIITIKNNGIEGRNNYCRYIEDDECEYPELEEKEVLITAFCIFKITKIEGKTYYLDCEGY